MAEKTGIAWTDHTFNCWRGCQKVSPACQFCYAENDRSVKMHGIGWGSAAQGGTRVKTAESYWKQPLKWNRQAEKAGERRRVFCASLADVFEDWDGPIKDHNGNTLWVSDKCPHDIEKDQPLYVVPRRKGDSFFPHETFREVTMSDLRRDLFKLIDSTPWLDWLLLTKRPENILSMWLPETEYLQDSLPHDHLSYRPNVWLGTTIESPEYLWRADEIIKCRDLCPVGFVSNEPALEAIDFSPYLGPDKINWVITGGESKQGAGHNPRPYRLTWAKDIINQCRDAGVSPFVKQLGSNPEIGLGAHRKVKLGHPKGEDISEWPEDLQVREFPVIAVTTS